MLLLCSRSGNFVILNVLKTGINAVSFLPVLRCVLGIFNSPVASPAHGLGPSLRLQLISENASLLCIFMPTPTVPLY